MVGSGVGGGRGCAAGVARWQPAVGIAGVGGVFRLLRPYPQTGTGGCIAGLGGGNLVVSAAGDWLDAVKPFCRQRTKQFLDDV